MKKQNILLLTVLLIMTACSPVKDSTPSFQSALPTSDSKEEMQNDSVAQADNNPTQNSKILVAYFSREDENFGVGTIEKGNTQIVAEMIAEEMNADSFEIVRVDPYPVEYEACTEEAKSEQSINARPQLTDTVDNFDEYDILFLGFPIWWSDMPMPVYTFLESYDFSGKTIIPFWTHAGGELTSTIESIEKINNNTTVLDGFEVLGSGAQNNQEATKKQVQDWLTTLSIEKQE